jgi:PAS domain S-box-containing protein
MRALPGGSRMAFRGCAAAPHGTAMTDTPAAGRLDLSALDTPRRLALLLDAVKDYAIYLLDREGRVASWNTGAARFKGYTADEIIGQHFSRFYTPEDRAAGLPERALSIAAETGTFEAEGWRLRKDGTRFWTSVVIDPVFEAGELIGFAKVTRDITVKKDADRALLESEQRFRLLVQGVRDYAIYMLDPTGHVTNWNAGAAAIKGYTAEEIVGQHFSRFYTEEDRQAGEPARALETAATRGKYEVEAWRQRKDGTRFRAGVLIDPIRDETGTLLGFAKVTRDLTERWEAQQAVERARDALAQAQKMEAIGRLTGGVAHDFNNLLTIIRAAADMLRRPELGAERRAHYVTAIADTADRAAELTGQLLAFARRQPLRPEIFDAARRVAATRQLIETSVGSTVEVVFELEPVGAVNADRNQFETAVLNLVINARDAMPAGGRLRVATRTAAGIPPVRGHGAAEGAFVAIEIEDTGSGIASDTLRRIFEPFFTTKGVNKGTGLGLSQVYGFAKQSGGEVDVRSTQGVGTCFTLYLPAAPVSAETPEAIAVAAAGATLPTRRVLLVEDNEAVGAFARGLLEELGQIVTWVANAEAALAMLETSADKFDLVFTDVVMPGISGIELALAVRTRWPRLPVVLTSGYSHVLAEQGSHGFELLKKPYSLEGLIALLQHNAAGAANGAGGGSTQEADAH